MKKLGFLGLGLATLLALVSCGKSPQKVIAGFNPELTTLSATYEADYEMVVTSVKPQFLSFGRDIDITTTIEADYTAGNLYLYAKKVNADNSYLEVLLVNEGGNYKYVTSTMADVETLENETQARTKMDELLKLVTYAEAGWVSEKSFVYAENYIHNQYLLDSENVPADTLSAPTLSVTESDGLLVTSDLDYVAYIGDTGGTFEFKGTNNAKVETNAKGLVVETSVTYNSKLDFPLETPPVPLDLDGSRSLSVQHGVEITKKESIEHKAPMVDVELVPSTGGSYVVKWFDYDHQSFAMNDLVDGQVQVGMWFGIKVTPEEGQKVEFVKVNGAQTEIVQNGYYCFKVTEKAQKVEVTFVPENEEIVTTAKVTFEQPANASLKVTYLDFNNGNAAAPQTEIQSGDEITIDRTSYWLCFHVTPEEGYELDKILINGVEAVNYGAWLYNIKNPGEYNVVVTVKATEGAPVVEAATVTYQAAQNGTFKVVSFTMGDFANMPEVASGSAVEVGKWLGVTVTPEEGYEIESVKVNGADTIFQAGFYCAQVKDTTALEVVVTFKEAEPVVETATVTYQAAQNGTFTVVSFTMGDFTNMPEVETGSAVEVGKWLGVTVTPEEGYEIDSVKVNGADTIFQAGFYCAQVKDTTALEVVVTFKAKVVAPAVPQDAVNVTISGNNKDGYEDYLFSSDYKTVTLQTIYTSANKWGRYDFAKASVKYGKAVAVIQGTKDLKLCVKVDADGNPYDGYNGNKKYITLTGGYDVIEWDLTSLNIDSTKLLKLVFYAYATEGTLTEASFTLEQLYYLPAPVVEDDNNEVADLNVVINNKGQDGDGSYYTFSQDFLTVTSNKHGASVNKWGRWMFAAPTASYKYAKLVIKGGSNMVLGLKLDGDGNPYDSKAGNKQYKSITEGDDLVIVYNLEEMGIDATKLNKIVFWAYDPNGSTTGSFTLVSLTFTNVNPVQ